MTDQHRFKQRLFFRFFKNFRLGKWAQYFHLEREAIENVIPKIDLKPRNIKNLKTLLDREELLRNMPPNKVIAEIGVDNGNFSEL